MPLPSYVLRSLLCFHYMSRCPDVRPEPPAAFSSLRTNTELISMKFRGRNHYRQQMTWLTFGQNVPGTTEQQNNRKFELTSNWCCRVANNFTNFTKAYTRHAASAGLASPLHTCSGGGIIWPRTVFISLVLLIFQLYCKTYFSTTDEFSINKFITMVNSSEK